STFSLLPDGPAALDQSAASGKKGAALSAMPLLAATPIDDLRELTFPYPDDATDVFTLKTDSGTGAIDQGTGQTLAWVDLTAWERPGRPGARRGNRPPAAPGAGGRVAGAGGGRDGARGTGDGCYGPCRLDLCAARSPVD